jgi:hypothetical protein
LQLTTPTNVIIESILCHQDNEVYVFGDDGFIMKGRNDRWDVVEQTVTSDHIVSSVSCGEDVYFSTEHGCIVRYRDGEFEDVTPIVSSGALVTTGNLYSNGDVVLSIGLNDIMILDSDGWSRVPEPPFSLE